MSSAVYSIDSRVAHLSCHRISGVIGNSMQKVNVQFYAMRQITYCEFLNPIMKGGVHSPRA